MSCFFCEVSGDDQTPVTAEMWPVEDARRSERKETLDIARLMLLDRYDASDRRSFGVSPLNGHTRPLHHVEGGTHPVRCHLSRFTRAGLLAHPAGFACPHLEFDP